MSLATTLAAPYRLSAATYHQMISSGMLGEDVRVELFDGETILTSPIGPGHSGHLRRLIRLLSEQLQGAALLSVQDAVHLDESAEPQPDLALLGPRADDYARSLPGVADILLLVEVADSSLEYDRSVKMPLYSRAGVVEAWVVNLVDGWVEVYREPTQVGCTSLRRVLPGKLLDVAALPNRALAVDDLLIG